ncbi:MAG: transcription termination factor NusA [Oscillospiraceae bacterium]|jgi:N utilization substance protein A|nr:transcription termination factor NusA [Oscillospiraceae bacterium]
MNRDVIDAIRVLATEKGINKEVLFTAIEDALKTAYRKIGKRGGSVTAASVAEAKNMPAPSNVRVAIDRDNGNVTVFARKIVVEDEEIVDDSSQIALTDARRIQPEYVAGDIVEQETTPRDFGRVAAQTAKQVILQRIREAERGIEYDEYAEKENEALTAIVERTDGRTVYVALGRTGGVLDSQNQTAGEIYRIGMHLKVYVLEVAKSAKGPLVRVSRTHPGLVKRLFDLESPEIQNGVVLIKSIAREAGNRTKLAVHSSDPSVDPVGACVGPRGSRVEKVVEELNGEKIDIIKWSHDPAQFVANALSPARAISVYISETEKACRVIVPDNQLSLAIGKEGQNARLAARLTGWRIDIKSQSQAEELLDEMLQEQAQEAEGQALADGESV